MRDRESSLRNAATTGGLGLTGICWAVNQIFPKAPPELLYAVTTGAIFCLVYTVYFWRRSHFKPDHRIIDGLFDLLTKADKLINEKVEDIADEFFYNKHVKEWIIEATDFIKKELNSEEQHMFFTMQPMILAGNDYDPQILKTAIEVRYNKLRLIMGRYFQGENTK